jgi:hypothetical protein
MIFRLSYELISNIITPSGYSFLQNVPNMSWIPSTTTIFKDYSVN